MNDDLLAALTSAPPLDKRVRCYCQTWINDQTPALREAIEQAMAHTKWSTAALFELFKQNGYEKQYNTLRVHRAGKCSCPHD